MHHIETIYIATYIAKSLCSLYFISKAQTSSYQTSCIKSCILELYNSYSYSYHSEIIIEAKISID